MLDHQTLWRPAHMQDVATPAGPLAAPCTTAVCALFLALERCAAALGAGLLAPPAGKLMCGTHSHAQDWQAM